MATFELISEEAQAEAEQRRLALDLIAECGAPMRDFRLMVAGAILAGEDGALPDEPTTEELTAAQYGDLDVINWHNRVTFDVRAIGENIKARSAELRAQIEARMKEAAERSPFRL